ncbi:MAG: transglycosylase SLT domain-containing protein [Myxococcales bacterium]|nr:transglycosylase SLT domain-containing protein [Myxococcales bacterium]
MERADPAGLTSWTSEDAATRRVPAAPEAEKGAAPALKWAKLSISMHVVLLAAAAAAGLVTSNLMVQLRDGQQAQADFSRARLEALASQTKALEVEVTSLRQTLTFSASEEVIFLKALVLKPSIDPELARTIAKSVRRNSELYRRDADLVLAIIAVESDLNPQAISSVGAVGLMQVMPHWKKVLGITSDLKDPDVSINYGLQILGFYEEMYRDLEMALTAYNRGPGPVDTALMKGRDPKNDYAARVLQTYDRLKKLKM